MHQGSGDTLLNEALKLAKLGFAVFPLSPGSKIPTKGSQGVKNATKNEDLIRKYWLDNPRSNIGVALGGISNCVAIDLDRNHGATEEDLRKFPRTVTAKTRNGYHLYFKRPECGVTNHVVIPSADAQGAAYLRSDGYYVVGPPSVVCVGSNGEKLNEWEYQWHEDAGGSLAPGECELSELPEWCLGSGSGDKASASPASALVASTANPSASGQLYPPNTRHDMLKRTAISMRKRGCDAGFITTELLKRNLKDCNPPKENPEKEIASIVDWVMKEVPVSKIGTPTESEYVLPLGHRDHSYYYTSSSNQQIVSIPAISHGPSRLLDLMPMPFWQKRYMRDKGGMDWVQATSDLMEECREAGIYDEQNMRGMGQWKDDGRIVLNRGSSLVVDGVECGLRDIQSRYTYILCGQDKPLGDRELTADEGQDLFTACSLFNWKDRAESAKLLAGALAIARISGSFNWRPMIWLTGPAMAGKTTVTERLIRPIFGEYGKCFLGNTTEAGIRQRMMHSSQPILFDEAETNDTRSSKRIRSVVELARQASSETGGQIYKGTPDGRGHSFKVQSMFFLSSIRVNLPEEADQTRFTVLELERGDPAGWNAVLLALDKIDAEYGDRLHARMRKRYATVEANAKLIEELIAEQGHQRRIGQQYGALLGGYAVLMGDAPLSKENAMALIQGLQFGGNKDELKQDGDEWECLNWLLGQTLRMGNDVLPVTKVMDLARGESVGEGYNALLEINGLSVADDCLLVSNNHAALSRIFENTKWAGVWPQSLSRVPEAERGVRHYFAMVRRRAVKIPLSRLKQ